MANRPSGTVTFLFTDIEGSTRLIQDIGERYAAVLADYRRLLGEAVRARRGTEIGTQGDGSLAAFSRASDGVAAAVAAQQALLLHSWGDDVELRVRMGLHTGEALDDADNYIGLNVHRAARICAAAHGGQILVSEVVHALAVNDLPSGISLRDLGSHHLRDLREPERLYQVDQPGLLSDFPPPNSIGPNNLPLQLTTFVGRHEEIPKIKDLLLRTRLLTLSGSGGLGKTRLAIQVAGELADRFADGVWLVELAPLTDPGLIGQAVASLFGLRERPGHPLIATTIDYFRGRHALLVLDNAEHLIEGCAQLSDALLRACPGLHILVTSRQSLGITGETTWLVPPLSSPEPHSSIPAARVAGFEAVRLFTDRAAIVLPQFSLTPENASVVAEVCARLDGIPLAIELAAARLRVLSIEQIKQRLHQRFQLLTGGSRTSLPRHQTLWAAIDWSYALLSNKENALFRRAAAFVGGCGPEAVEAVCAGDVVSDREVLELVAQLVDKSMLLVDASGVEVRYRMLDTILEFGRQKLQEAGEDTSVRQRHAEFFSSLADRAESQFQGPEQTAWLARLEADHDNLRGALEWSLGNAPHEATLQFVASLWWFWYVHGYYREGRAWMSRALGGAEQCVTVAKAKALAGAGYLATSQGDFTAAAPLLDESLSVARNLRYTTGIAFALNALGRLVWYQGNFPRASVLYKESLGLFRQLDDKYNIGVVLNNLGVLAISQEEFEQARSWLEESLALGRRLGVKNRVAFAASNLSVVALRRSDYAAARSLLQESLMLDRDIGDKRSISSEIEGFAVLAAAENHPRKAARLLGAADALRESIGSPLTAISRSLIEYDRHLAAVRSALSPEEFAACWRAGGALTLKEAVEDALRKDVEMTGHQ